MAETIDDNQESIIKEAVQHFVDAQLQDKEPDIDEFVRQYPGLERQIRQSIQDAQKIDALFDSLVQADESDFEDAVTGEYLVGEKIGSFEIVEMIGRGGMGVVYLARDTKLKRSVAIKSVPAKLAGDSTARTRFRREAELLASLNHPNIAVIHEIIEEGKSGYLVLEYIPGETLAERIARNPLKLEEALSIARQIAEAISAAHKEGIIHRDLKPGNIKITPDGRVKVLDFGLAKALVTEGQSSEITATEPGRVIGTPAYMSPEQARGKATDHHTDIWSFGCIMYQMLTGQLPFEGQTATDTLVRIIEHQPDWELLPDEIPENIRVLLRRCLEKDPAHRLGDIADTAIEISETLSKSETTQVVNKQVKSRRVAMIVAVVAISIILSGIALKFIPKKKIQPFPKEIRLVVLPFENLGSADDEWFADGMTDEITSRLAGIHGLGVISRQSAIQYKNKEKSTPQIAKELGVDYILEGTIQRERPSDPNSRVRIRSQLIRASDDTHVWAQNYDNDMSEVFRLQSEVAEQVAEGLDITLLEPERRALASKPTENVEAYEYYLRGNEYSSRGYQFENYLRIAIGMYERAVNLDDKFALAHAKLSQAYAGMYKFGYDHSEKRLAMTWEEANKALELDPELPEAHWALGYYYYWGHSDCDRALKHFEIALRSQPKNSRFISAISYAQKWQGNFDKALVNIKKAYELDPLSHTLATEAGLIYLLMRKYPEAERYCERAILLAPDYNMPYERKAHLYLRWQGSTQKAKAILKEALRNVKPEDQSRISYLLVNIDVYDGNYQGALDRLDLILEDVNNVGFSNALLYARIYEYMNNKDMAKKYFSSAQNTLERRIQKRPEYASLHRSLGIAYAGLGLKEDAIRAGKRGAELLPVAKNPWRGTFPVEDLARIYVMVGKYDAAIDQINFLLSVHGRLSIHLLQLDPAWAPLRNHRRFKKFVEAGK